MHLRFKQRIVAAVALLSLTSLMTRATRADEGRLKLDVSPVYSKLIAAEKQTTWVRVGLTGFRLDQEKQPRPGVNLAIVLDRSGSMQGDKIEQARNAAIDAVRLLNDDDILSIVTYDSSVNVLVPATKLSDRESVIAAIRGIEAAGNTALFAGVSKGAAEVRKFLDKERVNRVILLSDGMANVGPSSPGELAQLGKSLLKEGVSVSTLGLGLGYNEDLMVQLATTSGGNHLFIEKATELADIFRAEFDDVLSVVAQEVDITLSLPEGIRPVKVSGNEAEISGQQIMTRIAQVYSEQARYIVVEVEVPAGSAGAQQALGSVSVTYNNMRTHSQDKLASEAAITFTSNSDEVKASVNKQALADAVALISSEQNKLATAFLDQGDLMQCRAVLQQNVDFLKSNALLIPGEAKRLEGLAAQNDLQLNQLLDVNSNTDIKANAARKSFRGYQSEVDLQQRAKGSTSNKVNDR